MKKLLFFVFFMGLLAAFGNQGWFKFYKLRNFEKNIVDENRLLQEENETFIEEIYSLKDPKYLEHYIRDELGYLKTNEVLYERTP